MRPRLPEEDRERDRYVWWFVLASAHVSVIVCAVSAALVSGYGEARQGGVMSTDAFQWIVIIELLVIIVLLALPLTRRPVR